MSIESGPYAPPQAVVKDPPRAPPRSRFELVLAGLLLLNGALGATVGIAMVVVDGVPASYLVLLLPVPVLGIAGGIITLRWPAVGLVIGAIFYGVQTIGYASPDLNFGFSSGLGFREAFPSGDAIWVINFGAILFAFVQLGALAQRYDPVLVSDADATVSTSGAAEPAQPPASET